MDPRPHHATSWRSERSPRSPRSAPLGSSLRSASLCSPLFLPTQCGGSIQLAATVRLPERLVALAVAPLRRRLRSGLLRPGPGKLEGELSQPVTEGPQRPTDD